MSEVKYLIVKSLNKVQYTWTDFDGKLVSCMESLSTLNTVLDLCQQQNIKITKA